MRTFCQGTNHQTWLLESAGQRLVLKLFAEPVAARRSQQAQRWAARLDLAPPVRFVGQAANYMIMDYAGQAPIQSGELSNTQLQELAQALARLHNGDPGEFKEIGGFDLLAYCDAYLAALPADANEQHRRLLPVLEQFIGDTTETVVCHNDLVSDNCFHGPQGVFFIDWEFAQLNNPWFDLASAIYYWGIDSEQSVYFLASYKPGLDRYVGSALCQAAICSVLWLDILWRWQKFGSSIRPELERKQEELERMVKAL